MGPMRMRGIETIRRARRFTALLAASLSALAACTVGIAHADVDMTGRLEKASSLKTALGAVQPLATSANVPIGAQTSTR